jgi:drug/metabolite transporter (DMT)-like permease
LGIGDWGLGPIPNPQSPIPNPLIIFSVLFLGEKSWWFDYICCLSCFLGALLIVKPDFMFHGNHSRSNQSYLFFFGLVIIAAIFKACEDVVTRFIGKDMHFQAINLFYSSIGMLVFPLMLVIFNQPFPKISLYEVFIFMITGISAWIYQTFATMAFQNENAGRVSMINYLQVDFMYIIDLIIFNKPLLLSDLMGTLLIFSFNFANGLYKTLKRISVLNREIEKRKKNQNIGKNLQNFPGSPNCSAELNTGNSNKNNTTLSNNLV